MASVIYPKAKEAFLKADIDLENDTVQAVLIDTNDVAYNSAHDFYDDIVAAAVSSRVTLTNKSFTNGVFDADDIVFPTVSGDPSEAIVILQWSGSNATSRLIAFLDTGTGLPVTPGGGDIPVTWDNGASKIFAL